MLKLFKYFRTIDWIFAIIIIGTIIGQVYMEMELIKEMGKLIGLIKSYAQGIAPLNSTMLWNVGLNMLLYAFAIFACVVLVAFLAVRVSSNFACTLRKKTFQKINSFSMEEMDKFSVASLITRTTNDINQVQQTVQMMLRMMIMAPTMAIFALKEIIGSNAELSWTTIIAVGLLLLMFIVLVVAIVPKFSKIQKLTDRLNLVTRENLTGLRVIRAYNTEQEQQQKFEGVNENLTKMTLFTNKTSSIISPWMYLIMNGLSLAIYWLGAYLINMGAMQYEVMVTFSQYAVQVLMSFMFISMMFIMIPRGMVCGNRINAVLKTKTKIIDGNFADQTMESGKVEFKNVSFKYPNAEKCVLENISFVANKGETIAFIGSTGSGKSTLINLIPRFFDATQGEILVDDINVKDYKLETLNQKLGYVPQKGYLFTGTIESNLKYGKNDATEKEMENALKIAQANFVYDLEGKLNYPITQGGTNVSGGQRQRIAIARAIIRKPEIYIFDDSFSALDYKTDKQLRKALKNETKDSTKLIVAQRIGTIIDADKIIVLEEGKMVGCGTHKELLENCEVYRDIALSQLSKEELDG